MKKLYYLLTFTIVIWSTSCSKLNLDEAYTMGYDAGLGLPVCTYHASVFEILSKEDTAHYVYTDLEDMSMHVYWEEETQDKTFDFIKLSEGDTITQSVSLEKNDSIRRLLENVPEGTEVTLPKYTYVCVDTMRYEFNFNRRTPNVKEHIVDSILVSMADFNLGTSLDGLTLNGSHIIAEFYIPALKDCQTKIITIRIDDQEDVQTIRIPQFTVDFSDQVDDKNYIDIISTYRIVSNGSAKIEKDAAIDYVILISEIDYDVAYGRFWDTESIFDTVVGIKLPPTIREMAKNKDNKLLFHNPEIFLYLQHDVGADITYVIDSMAALDENGNVLKFADFGGKRTYTDVLNKPIYPYQFTLDTIFFDRNNGKTHELFATLPDSLVMSCHVYVGKKNGGHNDFLVNPPKMFVDLTMHMEMTFDPGTNYKTSDTIAADLVGLDKSLSDYVNIDQFHLILLTANTLPLGIDMDLVMLDENQQEVYRRPGIHMDCPDVDERGLSIAPTEQEIELVFEGEDIKKVLKTKKMCFELHVAGKDAQSMISVRADNAVDVKVSAYAKFKAKLDNIIK